MDWDEVPLFIHHTSVHFSSLDTNYVYFMFLLRHAVQFYISSAPFSNCPSQSLHLHFVGCWAFAGDMWTSVFLKSQPQNWWFAKWLAAINDPIHWISNDHSMTNPLWMLFLCQCSRTSHCFRYKLDYFSHVWLPSDLLVLQQFLASCYFTWKWIWISASLAVVWSIVICSEWGKT